MSPLIICLLFLLLMLSGCDLFKKTTKDTAKGAQQRSRETEMSSLILKTADKETQVYTYWNDSGFYQFRNIKEKIDQVKSADLKVQEKQEAKQELITKTSEPVKAWIYIGIVIAVIGCYFVLRRIIGP